MLSTQFAVHTTLLPVDIQSAKYLHNTKFSFYTTILSFEFWPVSVGTSSSVLLRLEFLLIFSAQTLAFVLLLADSSTLCDVCINLN